MSALDKHPVNLLDLYLAPSLNDLYIPIVARIQLMYQLNWWIAHTNKQARGKQNAASERHRHWRCIQETCLSFKSWIPACIVALFFLFMYKQVSFEVQTLAFRVCGMKNDTHGWRLVDLCLIWVYFPNQVFSAAFFVKHRALDEPHFNARLNDTVSKRLCPWLSLLNLTVRHALYEYVDSCYNGRLMKFN